MALKKITSSFIKIYKSNISRLQKFFFTLIFKFRYPETMLILANYYHGYHSQAGQDLYISSILYRYLNELSVEDDAWVVDVGANHPTIFSNTYFFEKYFKISCLAIEPNTSYKKYWDITRPNARFESCAAGSTVREGALTLLTPTINPIATTIMDNMFGVSNNQTLNNSTLLNLKIDIFTLDSLFKKNNIKNIILCSIDVEGNEIDVLRGIDFSSIDIYAFIIENNQSILGDKEIRSFMSEKGYIFIARFYGLDDIFIRQDLISIEFYENISKC
jgi:FkbM family methyltransferase